MEISVIVEVTGNGSLRACIESAKRISNDILIIGNYDNKAVLDLLQPFPVRMFNCYPCNAAALNNVTAEADNELILFLKDTEQLSDQLVSEIKYLRSTYRELVCKIGQRLLYDGKLLKYGNAGSDSLRFFQRKIGKWRIKRGLLAWYPLNSKMDIISAEGYIVNMGLANKQLVRPYIELTSSDFALKALIAKRNFSRTFTYLKPVSQFISNYVWHKGFLDGWAGFSYCLLNSYNSYLNYKKTRCNFRKLHLYNTVRVVKYS
jgi:hypothetical protein